MGFTNFRVTKKKYDSDLIHINTKKRRVRGQLSVFMFTDKDTLQTICYSPLLKLSGYGENEEKAREMLNLSIADYFEYLLDMPLKTREAELVELGWEADKFKNKDFSSAYIDIQGELKNLNAVEDKVERITIEA